MSTLTRPIEHLMGRLSFPLKFALITGIFMIPLIVNLAMHGYREWQEYQHNQLEIEGLSHIQHTQEIIYGIAEHGGLTFIYYSGNDRLKSQIQQSEQRVDQALEALFQSLEQSVNGREMQERYQALAEKWGSLKIDAIAAMEASDKQNWLTRDFYLLGKANVVHDTHSTMMRELMLLNKELAVRFNLENDPSQDTAFQLELLTQNLPQLMDTYTRMTGFNGGVIQKGSFTPESYTTAKQATEQTISTANALDNKVNLAKELTKKGFDGILDPAPQLVDQIVSLSLDLNDTVLESSSIQMNMQDFLTQQNAIIQELHQFAQSLHQHASKQVANRLERQMFAQVFLFLVLALSMALAFYFFLGFYENIVGTIHEIGDVATQLSTGDLSVRIYPKTRDEMSKIALSFNAIAQAFDGLVSRTKRSMDEVEDAVQKISQVTEETLTGTEEQKQQMNTIVVSMEQMSSTAGEVERNTVEAADAAKRADEESRHGDATVSDVVHMISALSDQVTHTTEVMTQLAENANNIGAVTDVIREIAEQTNLLALNAAIEAARAGEQGRGFAVVADEVRSLAQKTRDSTDKIQEMINELQSTSGNALSVIEHSQEQVEKSVSYVEQAGQSLKSITQVVTEINNMNEQIASAATEQAATTSEITHNIELIRDISDRAAEGANKMASEQNHLHELADNLMTTLTHYKVTR